MVLKSLQIESHGLFLNENYEKFPSGLPYSPAHFIYKKLEKIIK